MRTQPLCLLLLLWACGGEPPATPDADAPDSAVIDAGPPDATSDAGTDAGPACPEPFDLEPPGTDPPSAWGDVVSLDAVFHFDVAEQRTTTEVTWTLRTGPSELPIAFDLLQQPSELVVDGVAVPASDIERVVLPAVAAPSTIRLLPVSPCSTHVVTATYDLTPVPGLPFPVEYARRRLPQYDTTAGTVSWSPDMHDIQAGFYLESWLPASLVHDAFESTIRFVVVGGAPHRLFANGVVETAENDWTVRYPSTFRANSHFWYLAPSEGMRVVETMAGDVPITVVATPGYERPLDPVAAELVSSMSELVTMLGPYPHPAFLAVIDDESWGMEYAGATWVPDSALRHELVHSWIGRGAYPRRDRHNWIDEALATYYDWYAEPEPLPPRAATRLEGEGWVRGWVHDDHYILGAALFRAWAHDIGAELFHQTIRDFFVARQGRDYTTLELRTTLYCASRSMNVLRLFDRYVLGGLESPGVPDDCEP